MASTTKTTATKKTASTAKSAEKKPTKAAAPTKTAAKSAAKPAAKPAAEAAAKKPAAPRRKAKPADSSTIRTRPPVPDEQKRHYVEVAAYFIAERNGFAPGRELDHWAEAEAEIERLLAEGLLNP